MTESILTSVKEDIGFAASYTAFDQQIIRAINTAMMALRQIGLESNLLRIEGNTETWSDYLSGDVDLEAVKTYIFCRARKIVDPPTSGSVMQALNEEIKEAEWRISVSVDPKDSILRAEVN